MTTAKTLGPLTIIVVLLGPAAFAQSRLACRATAVSGDALEIDGQRVRLSGIQAPSPDALCEGKITQWPCGAHSRSALARLIDERGVECRLEPADGTHERRGSCRVAAVNVAESQVRAGWARTTDICRPSIVC